MTSYRLTRRHFIAGTGAAFGLHALLRNMEAAAQAPALFPGRLLLTHHPIGSIPALWKPGGSGSSFTFSPILKPFEDAGLRADLTILGGLDMNSIGGPGGGHEKGSVVMATASPTKWTRTGQTETDDPMAAGPSVDQLLLAKVAALSASLPFNSLQALCDDRIDHQEISCRCLTYSAETRPTDGVGASPGTAFENIPIRPELKPLALYARVFGTMMPGGTNDEALLRARAAKKSVLDFSLRELARMRTLAPSSSKSMMDAHETAIRDMEKELDFMVAPGTCGLPDAPPDIAAVADDGGDHPATGDPSATEADDEFHRQIGEQHMAVIRAAFACDLTRVATFQWSPGTNHIAFKGLHPDNPTGIYQQHPVSHRPGQGDLEQSNPDSMTGDVKFLANCETWYNTRMAELVTGLKTTDDIYGNNLLDTTVVPYLTEVALATHQWSPMPAMIFGGKSLGFGHGQYLDLPGTPFVDLWLSILAAFGVKVSDLAGEAILTSAYNGPIAGLRS